MLLLHIQPHLDVLMAHLSDLMMDADTWPETAQVNLYVFWGHLDQMTQLLSLSPLPAAQILMCLHGLWCRLDDLDEVMFYTNVSWHLDVLRQTLMSITPLVDEHLSRRFEFPCVTVHPISDIQSSQQHSR
jgi:hypothetical protein